MSTLNTPSAAYNRNRQNFFGGVSRRIASYRTYRQTLGELQTLSDRELNDLGIHRSQLRGIAYRAAYDG